MILGAHWPDPARQALRAALLWLLLLTVAKHAAGLLGAQASWMWGALSALQLYYPIMTVEQTLLKTTLSARGVHRVLGLTFEHWRRDVTWAFIASAATFPLFIVSQWLIARWWLQGHLILRLPPHALNLMVTQLLAVSLPEEVFYRGFLQPRLALAFPKRFMLWGAPLGWEWPLTALLFALGHFVGEYSPVRLATFFPGLLFGFLRSRTQGTLASIFYHAAANILASCVMFV